MTTQVQKYIEHYVIYFKDDEKFPPQEVSHEWWKVLMQHLNSQDFVMINGTFYNKYEIRVIKPIQVDYEKQKEIERTLWEQNERVQNKVKEYMKFDHADRTPWRIQNMIRKAKEELNIS